MASCSKRAAQVERRRRRQAAVEARLARLPPKVRGQIEAESPPVAIRKWIAYGATPADGEARMALALLLRRHSEYGGWRWPAAGEAASAWTLLRQWTPLAPTEIPRVAYDAVLARDAAAKGRGLQLAPEAAVILARLDALAEERDTLLGKLREIGRESPSGNPSSVGTRVGGERDSPDGQR
jgi:hypothetical protein